MARTSIVASASSVLALKPRRNHGNASADGVIVSLTVATSLRRLWLPPRVEGDFPAAGLEWREGDVEQFGGAAVEDDDRELDRLSCRTSALSARRSLREQVEAAGYLNLQERPASTPPPRAVTRSS